MFRLKTADFCLELTDLFSVRIILQIVVVSAILDNDENAFIAIPTQRLTLIPKTYVDILKYISIYN